MAIDYIVIGAGAAGCAVANRLSADPQNSVLLLEAGGADKSLLMRAPGGLMPLLMSGKFSWNYVSAEQKFLNGRTLHLPRGKVLGGGSSINGMIYDRGAPSDYDHWAALGNRGWSYQDVLPYFKRAETYESGGNAQWHGYEGPVRISRPGATNILTKTFFEAGQQLGYPYNDDTNGEKREGFGPIDMFINRGRRSSASQAYLKPIQGRQNLEVRTGAHVLKVILDKKRAIGVDVLHAGARTEISAKKEVILCAGGIASPQILLLSGIGNASELSQFGVKAEVDLPGVGKNLQDHLSTYVKYAATKPVSLYKHVNPFRALAALWQYAIFSQGPLASTGMEGVAYVRAIPGAQEPDTKLSLVLALMNDDLTGLMPRHGFAAHVCVVRPKSRGEVRLASADPLLAPIIDQNYLSNSDDLDALRHAIRRTREVFAQPAFDSFRGEELQPGPSVQTDDQLNAFIHKFASADFHTAGTCKMGSDEMSVVDDRLRVRGVEGLRVADTSIMPTLIGGNTNMPAIMIGEKAADIVLDRGLDGRGHGVS